MLKSLKALAVAVPVLLAMPQSADATVLYFKGTVDAGNNFSFAGGGNGALDNAPISGWFDYPLSAPDEVTSDGISTTRTSLFDPTGTSGGTAHDPYVAAAFALPFGSFFTAGGNASQSGATTVARNPGGIDTFSINAFGLNVDGTGAAVVLQAFSDHDLPLGIFSGSAGGLSDQQPIRWFGKGINTSGFFSTDATSTDPTNLNFGSFTLTWVATSPVPEPQTYATLLLGLGLLGRIVRRNNHASVNDA